MKCERCNKKPVEHVPDHPTIPWSGLGLCGGCYTDFQNDEFEVTVTVTPMQ